MEGLKNKMLADKIDNSINADNKKIVEKGNCSGIVNLSPQMNDADVDNTEKEVEGEQKQQIADPDVETGSSIIKPDADVTTRSKRKRDRENKVVSVEAR